MYHPSLSDIQALAAAQPQANLAPVYRDVAADLETPVSAFLKVARGDHSFLLESVEGGERLARYSFIGTEPYRVLRCGPYATAGEGEDPLLEIERELSRFKLAHLQNGLPRFTGGAVGFLAYEASRHFEPRVPLPAPGWGRAAGLAGRPPPPPPAAPYPIEPAPARQATVSSNTEKGDFIRKVERCRDYIVAGDIYQVQVSQRFQRPTHAHPFSVYRALRTVNPSPYMYYLAMGDSYIIGASPEMLVRVEDGLVENHPIAGTRRRGRDAEDERRMEEELTSDEKDRPEHIMLVDLSRNDVGRIAGPGSVEGTEPMAGG